MLSLSNGEWAEASGEGGLADGSLACEYVLCIRTLQGSSGPALAGPRVLQHFLGGGGRGGEEWVATCQAQNTVTACERLRKCGSAGGFARTSHALTQVVFCAHSKGVCTRASGTPDARQGWCFFFKWGAAMLLKIA